MNKILTPFSKNPSGVPESARITMDVQFMTGAMRIKSDPALPIYTLANLFLMGTSQIIAQLAQTDSMIIKPAGATANPTAKAGATAENPAFAKATAENSERNENAKESKNDNDGNNGSGAGSAGVGNDGK